MTANGSPPDNESVYSRSLEILLRQRGLRVEREFAFDVLFRGVEVGTYRADMIVERRVIIEIKSAETITDVARRQLRNYLAIARLRLGIVLNFGQRLDYTRVLHQPSRITTRHSRYSRNSHV
jgi:GxxExxY protein